MNQFAGPFAQPPQGEGDGPKKGAFTDASIPQDGHTPAPPRWSTPDSTEDLGPATLVLACAAAVGAACGFAIFGTLMGALLVGAMTVVAVPLVLLALGAVVPWIEAVLGFGVVAGVLWLLLHFVFGL